MKNNEIEKILLWILLVFFSIIGLIVFAPYIGYIILFLGVLIPSYLLLKKK